MGCDAGSFLVTMPQFVASSAVPSNTGPIGGGYRPALTSRLYASLRL